MINEFGFNLVNIFKGFCEGLVTFWNNYLNYEIATVSFNGSEYGISVLFLLTGIGLLICIVHKVIDLIIPN